MVNRESHSFYDFVEIVRRLRKECPWDSTQTHESLKVCLEDETKEVLEGIDILARSGQGENLCEELGDVLFNIILQSIIAQEEGLFTIEDVISHVSSKMIFRHPRIFSPENKEAVSLSWDELKKTERHVSEKEQIMTENQEKP